MSKNQRQELYDKLIQDFTNTLRESRQLNKDARVDVLKEFYSKINREIADLSEDYYEPGEGL